LKGEKVWTGRAIGRKGTGKGERGTVGRWMGMELSGFRLSLFSIYTPGEKGRGGNGERSERVSMLLNYHDAVKL